MISLASGCGGSSAATEPPARAEAAPPPTPSVEAPPEQAPAPRGDGQILRSALDAVLDGGLGRFLSGVETEPALENGRFVGFRLVSLYPNDERMADVGLRPGDVIVRVNGQPIERPEQALRVFDGLRVASELFIEFRRGDEDRELRFVIVEDSGT